MAQYIVSARKYRPDTFESLIGQDNIAKTLKNSILNMSIEMDNIILKEI